MEDVEFCWWKLVSKLLMVLRKSEFAYVQLNEISNLWVLSVSKKTTSKFHENVPCHSGDTKRFRSVERGCKI